MSNEVFDWAMKIKSQRRLSYSDIAQAISPLLGKVSAVSASYIFQSINRHHPTNGMRVAKAIIAHYTGATFDKKYYLKVG